MIGEVGEPHGRLLRQVAEHWNNLINHAIRELQGRADLDLDMRTDQVRIRDVDTAAVLVFELFNKGEGLASNVQLSLSVDEESLQLESQSTHYLPPMGQSDRISSEFTVLRRGAGMAPVTVEVRYDDPQREEREQQRDEGRAHGSGTSRARHRIPPLSVRRTSRVHRSRAARCSTDASQSSTGSVRT